MLDCKGLINFGASAAERIYYNGIWLVHSLITFAVRLLEGLFGIGMAGTVLVLVCTGVQDAMTILEGFTRSEN